MDWVGLGDAVCGLGYNEEIRKGASRWREGVEACVSAKERAGGGAIDLKGKMDLWAKLRKRYNGVKDV